MDHNIYKRTVKASKDASLEWRKVPAPQRGEIIRKFGDELRVRKKILLKLLPPRQEK